MSRLLSERERLYETDKISNTTFVEKKDILKILFQLWKDDFLHMEYDNGSGSNDKQRDSRAIDFLVYASLSKEAIKGKLLDFADNATEELYQMASPGSPLWRLDNLGVKHLDREVYRIGFIPNSERHEELAMEILCGALDCLLDDPFLSKMKTTAQPSTSEASWASETVVMNPIELVKMFMDVEQWSTIFSNIVSTATILAKLVEDGNDDGSLLVLKAEFCLPTPFPTTRETYFLRRSSKVNDRMWLIVDASLDFPCLRYHRKPSGCLIEQLDGGFSRITWVEHNERPNGDLHVLFRKLESSGLAFCASRWTTTLKHHAENQFLIKQNINAHGGGRSSLLRFAQRMSQRCITNMTASSKKTWHVIPCMGNDEHIFARNYPHNNPEIPYGHALTVATSVRLPFTTDKLYETLRCAKCRPKWDPLALGGFARKELHVAMGDDPSAGVSVLHLEIPEIEEPLKCLQACFKDSVGMYMVSTSLQEMTVNAIMQGGDPDGVGIMVSGVVVHPWDPTAKSGGSILSLSFEVLDVSEGSSSLSVQQEKSLYSLMARTISLIIILCTQPHEDGSCHEDA